MGAPFEHLLLQTDADREAAHQHDEPFPDPPEGPAVTHEIYPGPDVDLDDQPPPEPPEPPLTRWQLAKEIAAAIVTGLVVMGLVMGAVAVILLPVYRADQRSEAWNRQQAANKAACEAVPGQLYRSVSWGSPPVCWGKGVIIPNPPQPTHDDSDGNAIARWFGLDR